MTWFHISEFLIFFLTNFDTLIQRKVFLSQFYLTIWGFVWLGWKGSFDAILINAIFSWRHVATDWKRHLVTVNSSDNTHMCTCCAIDAHTQFTQSSRECPPAHCLSSWQCTIFYKFQEINLCVQSR